MKYVLALDVGTTALKASLISPSGHFVAHHAEEYNLLNPAPDRVELEPETYWRSAIKAARQVLSTSGVGPRDAQSVGVTSQGETLIVLDQGGRPLRNAIVWLDNRSTREADEITTAFGCGKVYQATGQNEIVPTWTATRIAWLRRHEPEVFRPARKFMLVEDYLLYRLTGRCVTDRALNPSTLYYDITTGDWWPEMLDFLGIRPDQLPELKTSGEIAGAVTAEAARETGLVAGIPVTTAPLDQVVGAVGAGNLEPGIVTETTGAALALCATLDRPVHDPGKRAGLYAHALPGRFVFMPWAPTAGMVLRWFRDEFGGGRDYPSLIQEAAGIAPGADGLLMLPHLCGAGCPAMNPKARGVFLGLTLAHGRGHFVRAILEAVAFMLRENLEMLEALGIPVHEVRSLGGAARSDLWLQIKADVCRKDLAVMECEEAAGLGTAMISFVGNGTYRSLSEASQHMVRMRRRVQHNPEAAGRYEAVYRRYQNLSRQTASLF